MVPLNTYNYATATLEVDVYSIISTAIAASEELTLSTLVPVVRVKFGASFTGMTLVSPAEEDVHIYIPLLSTAEEDSIRRNRALLPTLNDILPGNW